MKHRVSIGNGVIAKIKSILENMSLGKHYFKIAFLLRENLFLNGILYNSEVWPQITQQDLKTLAHIDQYLLSPKSFLCQSWVIPKSLCNMSFLSP